MRLVVHVTGDHVLARGDHDRLVQVVANLVDNAMRATAGQGWIELAVQGDPQPTLDVIDSGPGIPSKAHERVFERLVRLDEARSRHSGGAGLGLSIARAHGGELMVVPHAGGAHLRLVLPRP